MKYISGLANYIPQPHPTISLLNNGKARCEGENLVAMALGSVLTSLGEELFRS